MRFIAAVAAVLVLASCGSHTDTREITASERSEVLKFADEVEAASEALDVKALMALLAKDITIEVGSLSHNPRRYDYSSYEQYLTDAFRIISGYNYERFDEVISKDAVSGDITYTFSLRETYSLKGKQIEESHKETWKIRKDSYGYEISSVAVDP